MKVFVLEDDETRVDWIRKNFDEKVEMDLTDEADEAITLLRNNKYDLVFLDHDLGGEQMVSSDHHNTGATVAKIMHETPNKDSVIIVHSYNPIGAENMMNSMKDHKLNCHYCFFLGNDFKDVVGQMNAQA
jgi:CheY-like chemotaxis protein